MSDTVILALITALSGLAVAVVGAWDRHQLHDSTAATTLRTAADLVKHNAY